MVLFIRMVLISLMSMKVASINLLYNMEEIKYRAVIYLFKIKEVYGESAPSNATVKIWTLKLRTGRPKQKSTDTRFMGTTPS